MSFTIRIIYFLPHTIFQFSFAFLLVSFWVRLLCCAVDKFFTLSELAFPPIRFRYAFAFGYGFRFHCY